MIRHDLFQFVYSTHKEPGSGQCEAQDVSQYLLFALWLNQYPFWSARCSPTLPPHGHCCPLVVGHELLSEVNLNRLLEYLSRNPFYCGEFRCRSSLPSTMLILSRVEGGVKEGP